MAGTPTYANERVTLQGEMLTVSVEVTLDGVTETVTARINAHNEHASERIAAQLAQSVQDLMDRRDERDSLSGEVLADLGTRVEAARSKLAITEVM